MVTMIAMLLAAGVAVGQAGDVPQKKAALDPAIAALIAQFNKEQAGLREAPRAERVGPPDEPYMLRATHRRATGKYEVLAPGEGVGADVIVRVRATEFEKRATKVNAGDLEDAFKAAPWRETPRGYLLDFRLRWTGAKWEQQGPPVEHPTLGTVGRP